jgi:hypothetical protein
VGGETTVGLVVTLTETTVGLAVVPTLGEAETVALVTVGVPVVVVTLLTVGIELVSGMLAMVGMPDEDGGGPVGATVKPGGK